MFSKTVMTAIVVLCSKLAFPHLQYMCSVFNKPVMVKGVIHIIHIHEGRFGVTMKTLIKLFNMFLKEF